LTFLETHCWVGTNATHQRLQQKEYIREHPARDEIRQVSETGNSYCARCGAES
jgi:hypothetical protein